MVASKALFFQHETSLLQCLKTSNQKKLYTLSPKSSFGVDMAAQQFETMYMQQSKGKSQWMEQTCRPEWKKGWGFEFQNLVKIKGPKEKEKVRQRDYSLPCVFFLIINLLPHLTLTTHLLSLSLSQTKLS